MDSCSKDLINILPDPLLCHILSFLSTKEAASTSVLSRRWRYLLAYVPNLDFDDTNYLHPDKRIKNPLDEMGFVGFVMYVNNKRQKLSTSFQDFVDRILELQRNSPPLHKFFLKIVDTHDPVDPDCAIPWIHNVLARRVSDLYLVMSLDWNRSSLPRRIFLSETLVKLRINIIDGPTINIKDVHLPKLKTLHLESVNFKEEDVGFTKLLSGCHVLEELVLDCIWECSWNTFSVSLRSLKRLTLQCSRNVPHYENPNTMSFDTPSLVYLEYSEVIAKEYAKVNFHSLVEAKIDLEMPYEASDSESEDYMVANATDFIMGISNVQILYLSANTLEVLKFCCKTIPIFNNLTHLTIQSNREVGWESLPGLLKNCPNLQSLVFQGFSHKATDRSREDVCLCKSCEEKDNPRFLSMNNEKIVKQIEQVKHLLETMPNLGQLVLYYDSSFDEDEKVSTQLQMLTRVASTKCKVQLIPCNFGSSSDLPNSFV